MKFLQPSRRRSLFSEGIYIVLNIVLVVVVVGLVIVTESPWLAIAAVLLSKWRVFAVRPRYWMTHIQANLVDTFVSVSMAILLYAALGSLPTQIVLAALYMTWLLAVKPRSTRTWMAVQAGSAVFWATSALLAVGYDWPSSIIVAVVWVIGYAAAKHVLSTYDEPHRAFYGVAWAFFMAELGWIFYHWTFTYPLFGGSSLSVSQVAIIFILINFLAFKTYDSAYHNESVRLNDVLLPILLSVSVTIVLLVVFNTLPVIGG